LSRVRVWVSVLAAAVLAIVGGGAAQASPTLAAGKSTTLTGTVEAVNADPLPAVAATVTKLAAPTLAAGSRRVAPLSGHPAGPTGLSAAGCSRVVGRWGYTDQDWAWHYSPNVQIRVRDVATNAINTVLTGWDGSFDACAPDGASTVEVLYVLENGLWRVQGDPDGPYLWTSGDRAVVPGGVLDVGTLTTGDPAMNRGIHAYDEANDLWAFLPKGGVSWCWDPNDTFCTQMRVNWRKDFTDGAWYRDQMVTYFADVPDRPVYAVWFMARLLFDDLNNWTSPFEAGCYSDITVTTPTCAWSEGFAAWLAMTVYHDSRVPIPWGAVWDMESPNWYGPNSWGHGDAVVFRVVGALLDIADYTNEGPWDRYGEGINNIWYTVTHATTRTFADFWYWRSVFGFNVSGWGALACLFQNTIDYDFRYPLDDNVSYPLPIPQTTIDDKFGYATHTPYWSAAAIRMPSSSSRVIADLYRDAAMATPPYEVSASGSVTFFSVDSNRMPFGSFYLKVHRWVGADPYEIQLAQGTSILRSTDTLTFGSHDIVAVRDVLLTAGARVTITVTPNSPSLNPALYVQGTTPDDRTAWIQRPVADAMSSPYGGPGVAESVTFTPDHNGWYGVIITNLSGSGTMTLTRS
jgi:hypothetical protein